MKPLLLILAAALTVSAQTPTWKHLKEFPSEIPGHPGLVVKVSAAQIARGDGLIKLKVRIEYPYGAPYDIFKGNVPHGFDPSSISRIEVPVELNCKTFVVSPAKGSSDVYRFNGERYKSKEFPFKLESGHTFAQYFCELGEAPKVAPKLKPK